MARAWRWRGSADGVAGGRTCRLCVCMMHGNQNNPDGARRGARRVHMECFQGVLHVAGQLDWSVVMLQSGWHVQGIELCGTTRSGTKPHQAALPSKECSATMRPWRPLILVGLVH